MLNSKNLNSKYLVLLSSLIYQACAATPTFNTRPSSTAETASIPSQEEPENLMDFGQPGPQFVFRNYTFAANSQIDRPVVKVALVVDNSASMLDEQSLLASGLNQLIHQLEDRELNLDFYIYTTTQLGTAAQKPVASTKTYYRHQDELGQWIETTNPERFNAQLPVTRRIAHELNASLTPTGQPIRIRVDTGAMDFVEIKDQLQSIISQLGISGSDQELGLCSMGRLLLGNGPAAHRIFGEGDFAAFLLISDANDTSNDTNCLAYEEQDFGAVTPENQASVGLVTTNNRALANRWIYSVNFIKAFNDNLRVRYRFDGFCTVDGQTRPCVRNEDRYYSRNNAGVWNYPMAFGELNTANGSTISCSSEVREWMEQNVPRNYRQGECTTQFYRSGLGRTYTDFNFIDSNLCSTGFNGHNHLYDFYRQAENLDDTWLNSSCSGSGRMYPSYAGISSTRRVSIRASLDPSANTLREAIISKANQMFGEDGYFFSAIVFNPASDVSCAQPAEAAGTQYLQLAQLLGDRGSSYPICSEDYYPALSPVESFIEQIVSTSYQPPLAENEKILSATRIRSGLKVLLEQGVDYLIQGKSLRFSENTLEPQDQVELEIRAEIIPTNLED
jgi:hypothetical protein